MNSKMKLSEEGGTAVSMLCVCGKIRDHNKVEKFHFNVRYASLTNNEARRLTSDIFLPAFFTKYYFHDNYVRR